MQGQWLCSLSGGALRLAPFPTCKFAELECERSNQPHINGLEVLYSYLSDSIGSRRAAFHAGQSPKIRPMPTLATKPPIGAQSGT